MNDITNALSELQEMIGDRIVAYGRILNSRYRDDRQSDVAFASHEQYLAAEPALNFEYDAGYGGQELFGYVVFTDGSWLERHEYDGSEWWEYKRTPTEAEVMAFEPDR